MGFIDRTLRQDVTYWAPSAEPNRYGQSSYEAPVKLRGRWEAHETQIRNPQGELITSSTRVYLSEAVATQGRLALGDQTADPQPTTDSFEIQGFQTTPDIRAVTQQNLAYL